MDSASCGTGSMADRRERATISARIENAVVPELGALAARCSRLVGQASLAFSESPPSHCQACTVLSIFLNSFQMHAAASKHLYTLRAHFPIYKCYLSLVPAKACSGRRVFTL